MVRAEALLDRVLLIPFRGRFPIATPGRPKRHRADVRVGAIKLVVLERLVDELVAMDPPMTPRTTPMTRLGRFQRGEGAVGPLRRAQVLQARSSQGELPVQDGGVLGLLWRVARCRPARAARYVQVRREQIVQLAAGSGSEISQPAGRRREGRN
jgi:hypothetical protein